MKLSRLLFIAFLSAMPCQARKKPIQSTKITKSSSSTKKKVQKSSKVEYVVGAVFVTVVAGVVFLCFNNNNSNSNEFDNSNPKPLKNLECLYSKHAENRSDYPPKAYLQSINIYAGNHEWLKKGAGYPDEVVNIEPFIGAINLMANFGKEDKIDALVKDHWVNGKEWEEKDEQAYKETKQSIIKQVNHLARFIDQSMLDQVNAYLTNKGSKEKDEQDPLPAIYDEKKAANIRLTIPSLENKIKDLKYIIDISAIIKAINEKIKKLENEAKELEAQIQQKKEEEREKLEKELMKNYSNHLKQMKKLVERSDRVKECIQDFDTLEKRFADLQARHNKKDPSTMARLKKIEDFEVDEAGKKQKVSFLYISTCVGSISKSMENFKANNRIFKEETSKFDKNGKFDQQKNIYKKARKAHEELGENPIFNANKLHDRVKRDLKILDTLDGLKIDN